MEKVLNSAGPPFVLQWPMAKTTLSPAWVAVLVTLMLVSGCSNSLWTKWQDMQCVSGCGDPEHRKNFEQPLWQSLDMFVGESLFLLVVLFMRSPLNPWATPRDREDMDHLATQYGSGFTRLGESGLSIPNANGGAGNGAPAESTISISGATGPVVGKSLASTMSLPVVVTSYGHPYLAAEHLPPKDKPKISPRTLTFVCWVASTLDICGTTVLNVSLLFVPVSIWQMLRGALVLWVGLFSVVFLRKRLSASRWVALGLIMLGVSIVGLSGLSNSKTDAAASPKALLGIGMIFIAQMFVASMFVWEEHAMESYIVDPFSVVGTEGACGGTTAIVIISLLFVLIGRKPENHGGFFDADTAIHQIVGIPSVRLSMVMIAISIAVFNGTGLLVTKHISATTRSTIDTSRTFGIWIMSLLLGWEQFKWLQLFGFAVLVYGTLVFNGIISWVPQKRAAAKNRHATETSSLLE